jgi:hypothetical protein
METREMGFQQPTKLGSQQSWAANKVGQPTKLGSQQSWAANKVGQPTKLASLKDQFSFFAFFFIVISFYEIIPKKPEPTSRGLD